jgi:hypothetical protein
MHAYTGNLLIRIPHVNYMLQQTYLGSHARYPEEFEQSTVS